MFDFYLKELKDRAQIALEHGEHIGTRLEKNEKLELYYLHQYYVELAYKKNNNKLIAVRGFKNPDLLQPYLESRQYGLTAE
jgi:hypothetical protein